MTLGLGIGDCVYCGHVTAIRYRNIYVCADHLQQVERDDPAPVGKPRSRPTALVAPAGFAKVGDVPKFQTSIPGLRKAQEAALGPVVLGIAQAQARGVAVDVEGVDAETAAELQAAGATSRSREPGEDDGDDEPASLTILQPGQAPVTLGRVEDDIMRRPEDRGKCGICGGPMLACECTGIQNRQLGESPLAACLSRIETVRVEMAVADAAAAVTHGERDPDPLGLDGWDPKTKSFDHQVPTLTIVQPTFAERGETEPMCGGRPARLCAQVVPGTVCRDEGCRMDAVTGERVRDDDGPELLDEEDPVSPDLW